MYKKIIEWWKNLTLVLALPLMVVNTIMDYYDGWETRELDKQTEQIQKQKDDAFQYHRHYFEDEYSVLIDADGQEVRILEHERGEVILPDTLTYNSFDFLTEYDETPQEKVDNILTKVFKPIQNVVGKVTSWFKWHFWEKWMERKKREDLIEKGIRG